MFDHVSSQFHLILLRMIDVDPLSKNTCTSPPSRPPSISPAGRFRTRSPTISPVGTSKYRPPSSRRRSGSFSPDRDAALDDAHSPDVPEGLVASFDSPVKREREDSVSIGSTSRSPSPSPVKGGSRRKQRSPRSLSRSVSRTPSLDSRLLHQLFTLHYLL